MPAWLPATTAFAQTVPEVTGVRFGTNGDKTRVVVDIKPLVEVTSRVTVSPPRLVIDLPTVKWNLRRSADSKPRGFAKSLRYGQISDERSRLVIDLATVASIVSRQYLPGGQNGLEHARIVVDLGPAAHNELPKPPPKPPIRAETPPVQSPAKLPEPQVRLEVPPPVEITAPESAFVPVPRSKPPYMTAEQAQSLPVIAIDAGHGGIDPGAIAHNGTYEKTITLAMARELADLLEQTGRYRPFLVRDNDDFIKLRNRIDRARGAGADVFISIHADSIGNRKFSGASVYTLSENASDKEAGKLAAKENKADIIGGTDLSRADDVLASILIDLSQRSTNNESIKLADLLVDDIGEVTKLVRNTRRYAGFAVLKAPDMPSVLVELGYLSNASDAQRLAQKPHRLELAKAMLRSLDKYFQSRKSDG